MDDLFSDLHACINSLGSVSIETIAKHPNTKASLRDIFKYLRKESSQCEIRLELGKFNFVEKCLVGLIKSNPKDLSLYDLVIRLLMSLTQPAFLCFKQQLPTDVLLMEIYIEVDNVLQKYKSSFADHQFMSVLVTRINNIINKTSPDRSEEDNLTIERSLILLRNILHINTSKTNEKIQDGSYSKHDRLVMTILESGWENLLIYLSNMEDEDRFAFHTLEIISLMFREQKSETIIPKPIKLPVENKKMDEKSIEQEIEDQFKSINHRSQRFGSTFVLPAIKCSSGLPMIYHHDIFSSKIDLSRDRQQRRKPANRLPNTEELIVHRSPEPVLRLFRTFCENFLEFGYANLMGTALDSLSRKQCQPDDETYYLWALGFFPSICRRQIESGSHAIRPEFVMETVTQDTIIWVHRQIMDYFESMSVDRKRARSFYRKVQLATFTFNELLRFLMMLDQYHFDEHGNDIGDRYKKLSAAIKCHVFWNSEIINMFPDLLARFNQVMETKMQLCQLIEGSYLTVKILQEHKSFDVMMVRSSRVKKRHRRQRKKNNDNNVLTGDTETVIMPSDDREGLQSIWQEIREDLGAAIRGETELPDSSSLPVLFDPFAPEGEHSREPIEPGSDPIDCQLKRALGRVQIALRRKKPLEAVGLLRLAQNLWPEEDRINVADAVDPFAEELEILEGVMMAPRFYLEEDVAPNNPEFNQNGVGDLEGEYEQDSEIEEESERVDHEELFDLEKYLMKYSHPNVVRSFGILFNGVLSNSATTNRSLLRMMHHISEKLHKPHALYQLRLFHGFNQFLKHSSSSQPQFKEMRKFVLYIIRKFVGHVQTNRKLLIEILFTKNIRECDETVFGYNPTDDSKDKPWTQELDDELVRLFNEAQYEEILPGLDVANVIENRFSDTSKSRRQIISRMVTLRLITSAKDLKKKKPITHPWSVEEESRLIILVEEARGQPNPIKEIMNGLKATSLNHENVKPKRVVVKKILEMGLVKNREELGIKSKVKKVKNNDSESSSDEEEDNQNGYENEEEDEEVTKDNIPLRKPPPLKPKRMVDWTTLKIIYAHLKDNEKEWLVNVFADNMDLRTNGAIGESAIIPLEDYESEILTNPLIEKIFSVCFFLQPDLNSQFWRIPADMNAKELWHFKNCVTSLTEEELKTLATSNYENLDSPRVTKSPLTSKNSNNLLNSEHSKIDKEISTDSGSDVDDFKENLFKLREKRKKALKNALSDDEESDRDDERKEVNFPFQTQESNDIEESTTQQSNTQSPMKRMNKKRRIFDSDSDDDIVVRKSEQSKRIKIFDEDDSD